MNTVATADSCSESRRHSSIDYVEHLQLNAPRYFPAFSEDRRVDVELQWEKLRSNSEVYEYRISQGESHEHVIVKVPCSQRFLRASKVFEADPEADRPRMTPRPNPHSKGLHEYDALVCIEQLMSEHNDDRFDSIRPLELLSDPYVLIMKKGPNRDLKHYIRHSHRFRRIQNRFDIKESLHRSGLWLKRFHHMPAPSHAGERSHTRDEFVITCRSFWKLLRQLGESQRTIDKMERQFDRAVARHMPVALQAGLCHGDYAPRNILVSDSGVLTVFDTQARWVAPIYEDLAHFLVAVHASGAQVSSRGLLYSNQTLASLERAFLSGYFEESIDRPILRLFECQRLLEWWSSLMFRHHTARGLKRIAKGSRFLLWRSSLIAYLKRCLKEIE